MVDEILNDKYINIEHHDNIAIPGHLTTQLTPWMMCVNSPFRTLGIKHTLPWRIINHQFTLYVNVKYHKI
jgi:hypothetical protein